jgi:hypothetical protein
MTPTDRDVPEMGSQTVVGGYCERCALSLSTVLVCAVVGAFSLS